MSKILAILACTIALAGCASVSVKDVQKNTTTEPKTKPETLYVMDFSTESAEFNVDREGKELETFKTDLTAMLSDLLVERLGKAVAPAQRILGNKTSFKKGWLVTGRFIRVNQGSRALRMTLGLGAGGTKMETEVLVYDLSISRTKPFMRFVTTGGSNAEPGILTSPGPISAGLAVIKHTVRGLSEDANRTSRETTAALSEYMAERGFISTNDAQKAKKLGETGNVL